MRQMCSDDEYDRSPMAWSNTLNDNRKHGNGDEVDEWSPDYWKRLC